MGRLSTRLVTAVLAIALLFGGYWVGRSVYAAGHENNLGAKEITVTTTARQAAAARARRRKRNREVLEGLIVAGALFVVVPAIFALPGQRRQRQRRRQAGSSRRV